MWLEGVSPGELSGHDSKSALLSTDILDLMAKEQTVVV